MGGETWSAVSHAASSPFTPASARVAPSVSRDGARLLRPWLYAVLLVPAVVLFVLTNSTSPIASLSGKELEWQPINQILGERLASLAQPVGAGSKRAAIHNLKSKLAEKIRSGPQPTTTPNNKVVITMYMESECPACRKFSTTLVKEILDAPGVGDIVDFRPIPWGWGSVIEAPTPQDLKQNITFNTLNSTTQLLPILARLGSQDTAGTYAAPPPLQFQCQHGQGECTGNALEACLVDIAPQHQQFFPMMDCLEARTCAEGMKPPACVGQPLDIVGGCLKENPLINTVKLNECYSGPRVQELMIINDMQTIAAKPQWVPWFQMDGQDLVQVPADGGNSTALFREQFLMGKKICDAYVAKTGNPAPAGCATFPQSDADIPHFPFSQYPDTNFTTLIATDKMAARAATIQLNMWNEAEKREEEEENKEHATLHIAAAARKEALTKHAVSEPGKAAAPKAALVSKPVLPAKVQQAVAKPAASVAKPILPIYNVVADEPAKVQHVQEFAKKYFGHTTQADANTKKLIAESNMPKLNIKPVAAAAKPVLPGKIQNVVDFADAYFGHTKQREAIAKKLIADADKPILHTGSESKFFANKISGGATDKMAAAVKSSETDASARQWKPPPTYIKLPVTAKQSKAKTGMLNEVMDFFGM